MKGTKIIIAKELKRVFGDRKLVFSLFILPAILMIGIYSLMGMMIGSVEKDITEHISTVYFVNAGPTVKQYLGSSDMGYAQTAEITYLSASEYSDRKEELDTGVLEGNIDLVAVFDDGFEDSIRAYAKAGDLIPAINIYYNYTENYSSQAYSNFSNLLAVYKDNLLAERIGDMASLTVFSQNVAPIVKEEKANTEFISMMLPYLITMLLFAGTMSVGVDAIAGEKERGTLASMLLSPIKRKEIVVGKLVSMAVLSGLSAIVYSVSMIIAMPMMGKSMGGASVSGFGGVSFSAIQCIELLLIMLAMVYLYVTIIGLLAVLAKDTKTASTYVSPVYIVVIVAGLMTMFISGKEIPMARYFIPIYGNALAIRDLCGNELMAGNFLASLAGTLIVSIILTVGITKAFNSEKIMFNA